MNNEDIVPVFTINTRSDKTITDVKAENPDLLQRLLDDVRSENDKHIQRVEEQAMRLFCG